MSGKKEHLTYNDYFSIGFKYLQSQKDYLLFNIGILAILIVSQLVNWLFIINVPPNVRPAPLEVHTPLFILLVISLIIIVYIYYFRRFLKQLQRYKKISSKRSEDSSSNDSILEQNTIQDEITFGNTPSITETMYSLNSIVEKLQLLFIIVAVFSFFYVIWFSGFFVHYTIFQILSLSPPPPAHPIAAPALPQPPPIIQALNYLTIITLILFFIINLRYYYKWHKKIFKLKNLEKQIYKELDLEI